MPTKTQRKSKAGKGQSPVRRPTNASKKNGRVARKPVGDPFPMRLRGNLLFRFRALAAEYGEARVTFDQAKLLLDIEQRDPKYKRLLSLMRDHQLALSDMRDKKAEFAAVQKEVADKFDISVDELERYTFNTETGVVTFSPPREPEERRDHKREVPKEKR